ncbi:hypothetical protein SAMN02745181_0596 [Rubritalea squalenifaciens DSM 18772]|uniref:Uncharacterized protein n=1 Tax=Rubritalea squalenifaciens DSM 18772 TaxID=1123071 RepID=A0A1M6CXP4_9BACT|nr:hypothetical protein [Rubritalea squalenifaciens]SHI65802.1 hypothetical protein SAMN02745181_0596 [Rubritalea squalenifaciens DSM 18772]
MDPNNISLITIAPFGSWDYSGEAILSVNKTQYYTKQDNKVGIQYWVLNRFDPTSAPLFTYFQEANNYKFDTVPPGLDKFVDDDYIIIVATQGIFITQVPQGALYQFLVKIGAGSQLDMLEQLNTYYACGFTGKVGYTLITVPSTQDSGIESGAIPHSVYVSSSSQQKQYGSATYPGGMLVAQLVPTEYDGKKIYTPVLTSKQSVY